MPSAMGEKYNYLNMVMYGCGLAKGANEYLMAHVTIWQLQPPIYSHALYWVFANEGKLKLC